MKFGIFSKVFAKYSLTEAFSMIKEYGFNYVQFNMNNVGLDSMPEYVSDEVINEIKATSSKYGTKLSVLSATFNTLELDEQKRLDNLSKFKVLLDVAVKLDIKYVSISTGSFNQEDFWSPHPANQSDQAWKLLLANLDIMLKAAASRKITILIEPEQANVIQSAKDTLKLLNHYQSDYLKVLYDPANLMTIDDNGYEFKKIKESLKLLSRYIEMAHLKDFDYQDNKVIFVPVGKGKLNISEYLNELRKYYQGEVIMHDLEIINLNKFRN